MGRGRVSGPCGLWVPACLPLSTALSPLGGGRSPSKGGALLAWGFGRVFWVTLRVGGGRGDELRNKFPCSEDSGLTRAPHWSPWKPAVVRKTERRENTPGSGKERPSGTRAHRGTRGSGQSWRWARFPKARPASLAIPGRFAFIECLPIKYPFSSTDTLTPGLCSRQEPGWAMKQNPSVPPSPGWRSNMVERPFCSRAGPAVPGVS